MVVDTALRGTSLSLLDEAAADAADYGSFPVIAFAGQKGAILFFDISAESGTATFDAKVQAYDSATDAWFDIPGASIPQQSGVGSAMLTIYPGIATSANVKVAQVLPPVWRVLVTIGSTGNMDFTVSASLIK